MIRLNVFIQVEKQNYDQVVNIAKELVAASQKDNGCVAYDLFQSTTRQDVLMICETWKDAESLSAHDTIFRSSSSVLVFRSSSMRAWACKWM